MANLSKTTQDHDEIRRWAEERGGKPARVKSTGGGEDVGILRIDFPGYSGEESLESISWDDFFEKFDEHGLALVYQEETSEGARSNFNKIVKAETAAAADARSQARARAPRAARPRKASAKKAVAAKQSPVGKTAAKKAPAKKAAAKKGIAKKAAAKKSPAKKTMKKAATRKSASVRKASARSFGSSRKSAARKGGSKKAARKGR